MLQVLQVPLPATFPRMTYAEAMAKYGTDRPDLRYDLQLHDVTQAVRDSEFRWAAQAAAVACHSICMIASLLNEPPSPIHWLLRF